MSKMDSDALSIISDGLSAVTEGCRLPVRMKNSEDWPKAEVICMRQNKGSLMYYVHYVDYNKRLDEWVSEDRLDTRKIEPPQGKDDKYVNKLFNCFENFFLGPIQPQQLQV